VVTTPTRADHVLVFAAQVLERLQGRFSEAAPDESAAFVLARPVSTPDGRWRLIAYDVVYPEAAQYKKRTSTQIELPPETIAPVIARARSEGASVILTHSHPGGIGVVPSLEDLEGEARLRPTLERRVPRVPHGRLIVGSSDSHAAIFLAAGTEPMRVIGVGEHVVSTATPAEELSLHHDRQVRAFGAHGQRIISSTRVGIVGLGGTGSVVAQQLAHLGIGHLLLIDPDSVELTNLNRVVGSQRHHAEQNTAKVTVAREMIVGINPDAKVVTIAGDIRDAATTRRLLDCDFFFCCTDSQGSRAVLTQFAYQYLVPAIDVGVAIHAHKGAITHIAGRVQMLAPGIACLLCGSVLDAEEVRRDLLTDTARRSDPYIVGEVVPQPAVISLNSSAASLAVTMMLSALTGIPVGGRNFRMRVESGVVKAIHVSPNPRCPVCSATGAFAKGDVWPSPGRKGDALK
jgi:proteasome lid subunit RPN8/RPN11